MVILTFPIRVIVFLLAFRARRPSSVLLGRTRLCRQVCSPRIHLLLVDIKEDYYDIAPYSLNFPVAVNYQLQIQVTLCAVMTRCDYHVFVVVFSASVDRFA